MIAKFCIYIIFGYLFFLPPTSPGSTPKRILQELQNEISGLIEEVKPSVVTISSKTSHSYTILKENGIFSFLKEDSEKKIVSYNNICSGFIYNSEGYIITKTRFINENEEINIILNNGDFYKPIFIGNDDKSGITVLKIDATNLIPVRVGNIENVAIGHFVAILGNSMSILPAYSFGLVNGFLKDGLLQLSTIISPCSNGSPVFNIQGEIIGIIAAQLEVEKKSTGDVKNIFAEAGLALPINQACLIAEEIIKLYKEQTGWIGIQLVPDSSKEGIVLDNVLKNSPAGKAGLKKNDVLLMYNNVPLANPGQFGKLVRNTKPGTTIPINFLRHETRLNVFVTIEKRKLFLNNNNSELIKQ